MNDIDLTLPSPKEIGIKALKGSLWGFISILISRLFTPVVTILLARFLDPSDFGLMAYVTIFTGVITLFQDLGMNNALIQTKENIGEASDIVFINNIILGFIWFCTAFFMAPYIAAFFEEPKIIFLLRVCSISFIITSFSSVQEALLAKDFHFKRLFMVNLVPTLFSGITTVVLAYSGLNVWALIIGSLTGLTVNSIVSWNMVSWRPGWSYNKAVAKDLIRFGKDISIFNILGWAVITLDDVIVGKWLGASNLGIYRVGFHIGMLPMSQATSVITKVAFPAFSKFQNNMEELHRIFLKTIKYTSLATFPMGIGLIVISPVLVPLFLGEKWNNVIPVIQLIAIWGTLGSVIQFCHLILKSIGETSKMIKLSVLRIIILIPLLIYVVPKGIIMVGVVQIIVTLIFLPVFVIITCRRIKISPIRFLSSIKIPVISSVIMGVTAHLGLNAATYWLIDINSLSVFFTIVLLSALFYIMLVYLLGKEIIRETRDWIGILYLAK